MSDIGKIPNPLNPANDPKKEKPHSSHSSQFGEKFDYRKQEGTSSGRNKQRYSKEEEEQVPKSAEKPTPDSIFKPSSSGKISFQEKKNIDLTHKKELSFSPKKAIEKKESIEELSTQETIKKNQIEKNTKKKEPLSANPLPETPPKTSFQEKSTSIVKPKEKKKEEAPSSFEPLANIQQNQPSYQPPLLPTGSGFSSYQISQLFDRITGIMTVMELSGVTTTELTLSGEEFASSIFYGARITITEHSTAPKAFNVQLSASPEAVASFQRNMPNLLATFESGNYAFRIHRLDTSLLDEKRPLFKRKESFGSDQQPTQGDS